MISLQDALKEKREALDVIPKARSERASLFGELYEFYEKDYKRQTWLSYIKWLKENRFKHNKERVMQYKKVAFPKITIKSFCSYWLCHMKTEDLYYLISIARDHDHRGTSFNRWLFWALKADSQNTV